MEDRSGRCLEQVNKGLELSGKKAGEELAVFMVTSSKSYSQPYISLDPDPSCQAPP